MCKDAFLKKFDAIIGWDVSRFGRSMKEFVSFLADMDDKGIGVIPVKNGWDTVLGSGRMMMKLIRVMEEWNREMLIERTNAGLARTVANGTKLGRRKTVTDKITLFSTLKQQVGKSNVRSDLLEIKNTPHRSNEEIKA